ncbi:TonB-dependent receptor plug domain-containing protein [Caulobacter sp. NIBR2454]|uniref:TonB-dependent receptor plug domain-containing protein n=1 Tax=Caulobacter sp. NIBR2454 TaxID=3015996 RepID=UPI0022B66838|nr:TonB-dependent receptor [Caulobacter sp. NIBR2454]
MLRVGLLAGISTAAVLMGSAAMAQTDIIEEVVVTGSRGKPRTVQDSPVPIDSFSAEDIKATGFTDTNDVLKTLVPSYTLARQPISDGATFIRPASLRGLSTDKTLMLINSKRRHRAALVTIGGDGSQAADAATIPSTALKSVEVLRDGAGAQYGSDAIAGVINFILKDDAEGGSLIAQAGQFYEKDGEGILVSGNIGMPLTENGFANLSFEYTTDQPTSRGRQYCNVGIPNVANGFCVDTYAATNPVFAANVKRPVVQKWGQPESEAFRAFLNTGLELGNGSKLYAFANYSKSHAKEDFNYRFPAMGQAQLDNPIRLQDGSIFRFATYWPGGFTPQFFGDVTDYSLTGGWKGDITDKLSYDLSGRFGYNKIAYKLTDTMNPSMGPASPEEFHPGDLISEEAAVNADFVYELGGFTPEPVTVAFGGEYRKETYKIITGDVPSYEAGRWSTADPYDFCTNEATVSQRTLRPTAPQTAGINCASASDPVYTSLAVGSNGFPGYSPDYSGKLSRDSYGVYVDASTDLTEQLFVQASVRAEDFSDFGSTLDGKLAAMFKITPTFGLRGSVGSGFRAPTPGQLFTTNVSTRVENGLTIASGLFPASNAVSQFLGAEELGPEKSTNFSLGFTATLFDGLSLTVDAYYIKIKDMFYAVTPITVTPAIRTQLIAAGVPGADTIGQVQFFQNAFDSSTRGIDVVATYRFNWENGQSTNLMGSFNYNKPKVDKVAAFFDREYVHDYENGTVRWRGAVTATHDIGKFTLMGRANVWGPYKNQFSVALPIVQEWDPVVQFDTEISYDVTENYRLTLGGRNIFDKYPDPDATGESGTNGRIYRSDTLVDWQGGFYYAKFTATF